MTEQDAFRKFTFMQTVRYDNDAVDVYFDVEQFDGQIWCCDESQVFYRGANITNLVNLEEIDEAINWKKVKEEMND